MLPPIMYNYLNPMKSILVQQCGGHVKMVWVQLEESAPHMNIGG